MKYRILLSLILILSSGVFLYQQELIHLVVENMNQTKVEIQNGYTIMSSFDDQKNRQIDVKNLNEHFERRLYEMQLHIERMNQTNSILLVFNLVILVFFIFYHYRSNKV